MFYKVKYRNMVWGSGTHCYYLADMKWQPCGNGGYITGRWVVGNEDKTIDPTSPQIVCGAWPLQDIGLLELVTNKRLIKKLEKVFNEN